MDVLDPMVNVSSTSFLYELHSNFGNWDEAIKDIIHLNQKKFKISSKSFSKLEFKHYKIQRS